ncbi:MAG TPA: hypothetical protein VEY08_04625 [Chloroflexia bacterium]|nr:hypothetical protein [Chloroflexia bacterium]
MKSKHINKHVGPQSPDLQRPSRGGSISYNTVFLTVVGFTVLSLIVSVLLSFQHPMTEAQVRLFDACTLTWHLGVGAIFGLMGSKALDSGEK